MLVLRGLRSEGAVTALGAQCSRLGVGARALLGFKPCSLTFWCSKIGMAFRRQDLVWITILILAIVAPRFTAQPPTADDSIDHDRQSRQTAVKGGKNIAITPKWGFFGTIFHLILEQVNDTKSAYIQISDLVNGQFVADNAPTKPPPADTNGTTETPKITRSEFLKILDRNLKGLSRLRNLEWREAKKDSAANLRAYNDEIFRGKQKKSKR